MTQFYILLHNTRVRIAPFQAPATEITCELILIELKGIKGVKVKSCQLK